MTCPTCKGLGYVERPYYSDFEPHIEPQPCPDCQDVRECSPWWGLVLVAFLLGFTALICWGMP